jgi:hypothetical protein
MARFIDLGWLRRDGASRAIGITPIGISELRRLLQIDAVELLDPSSALSLRGRADKPFDSNDVSAVDETRTAQLS